MPKSTVYARVKYLPAVCLLVGLTGCATLSNRASPREPTLSREEARFAEALAHFAQALIYEETEGVKSPEVVEHFAKSMELDPHTHKLHTRLAVAYLRQERPDKAIEVLEASSRANPDSLDAWLDLAATCQLTGRVNEALEHFREALELSPERTFIYAAVAKLLFLQKKDDEAIRTLEKGVANAKSPETLITFSKRQGRELVAGGEAERSIRCFEFIGRNDPAQRGEMRHFVGELHLAMGNNEEAAESFALAIEGKAPLAESFVKLALIQLDSDPSKAIKTLLKARETTPGDVSIPYTLAAVYNQEGRFDEAAALFQEIQKSTGKASDRELSADFYFHYGATCEQGGRFEKAEGIFEKCIAMEPKHHQALNYLAYMWAEKGIKLTKALEYVTRALELDPGNGAYVDTLGWVYYKQEQYNKALEHLQRAAGLVKDDPTITDHLGDTFIALENADQAIVYWKQSFLLDPENEAVAEKLQAQGVDLENLRKKAESEEERSE